MRFPVAKALLFVAKLRLNRAGGTLIGLIALWFGIAKIMTWQMTNVYMS